MDEPAYCGLCHCGKFRCGSKGDLWKQVTEALQKPNPASMGGTDPCTAGEHRAGMYRAGVDIPIFDQVKEALRKKAE